MKVELFFRNVHIFPKWCRLHF